MINKLSDRILSFQIKRAIQAEDTLHAAQKEIARLKSNPKLTDAEIRIEFARAIEAHILGDKHENS